ncbi:hypothetical protein PHO31112_05363 [Pandoraea horticolens]|uniref:Uncharacterized protein n=2 Tax=Pandoraea horticolens TaxID=2508298 RepID=A0A5E4ZDU7_9BURK|nr:hypothetical protein PHO31112_05363 [Pandoraea horticolens]
MSILGACSVLEPTRYIVTQNPTYDPATSARLRVHGSNAGGVVALRFGEDCFRPGFEEDGKTVYGQGGGFFTAYKYSSTSVLIGMPESPRKWMRADGLKFKDYIMEYVVPANAPTTIFLNGNRAIDYGGSRQPQTCSPPSIKFTPLPGKDYEAFNEGGDGKCWIEIREIDARGHDIPVLASRAPRCTPIKVIEPTKTGPDAER